MIGYVILSVLGLAFTAALAWYISRPTPEPQEPDDGIRYMVVSQKTVQGEERAVEGVACDKTLGEAVHALAAYVLGSASVQPPRMRFPEIAVSEQGTEVYLRWYPMGNNDHYILSLHVWVEEQA